MDGIVWGQSQWWIYALGVWVVVAVFALMAYRRSMMPMHLRVVAVLLKLTGLAILLACLLEPLGTLQRPKPQANLFGILVDNSRSMKVALANGPEGQSAAFEQTLADDAEWQRQLSNDFRVRRYAFDETLRPADSFTSIPLTGNQSSIHGSLTTLSQRYEGRPVAGMVLFSDGQATDAESGKANWKNLGFPVYPVRLGKLQNLEDLRIVSVATRQSDFEASPVTMTATIEQNGLAGKRAFVELLDASAKTIQSHEIKLSDDGPAISEFRFRPEESGVQGYRIQVSLVPEVDGQTGEASITSRDGSKSPMAEGSSIPKAKPEITEGNNARHQVVDRGRGPYRVLYVAGRPNWEHKFLKRALDEDDEIELSSMVRIAKKEPKFSFRDMKVDNSNPLFSGFDDISEEEKEQYNQPVFIGLKSFPKTADELFEYQAIIIDDLEHDFFNQDQQSLLRKFVAVRGGGLLALGGQESMRGTGFKNSVLSQLLPVYGEEVQSDATTSPLVRYDLTREGWLQPFLRTADTEAEQRDRIDKMPPFEVLNRTRDIKPGASVLAHVTTDDQATLPALVTQRFGKGRTAALMIGDMWRWGLHHDGAGESHLFQAWRQTIRWLISDVPKKIEMRVEREDENHRAHRVVVRAQSSSFEPLDNAKVEITITKPDGKKVTALCDPSTDKPGDYETTIVSDQEGVFTASATVLEQDGNDAGTAQVGWVFEPSATEFQSLGPNEDELKRIAEETGGEVIDMDELESLVASLPSRRVPITETKVYPLWHQAWVLLLAIGCLCAEWGLRRWNGMV